MNLVVLIKEVPDTYGDRRIDLETGLADRSASDRVLDEIGERALEAALRHKEQNPDTRITVVSVGPVSVPATLRKALAMGADTAIHVADDALAGADLTLTAEVLAAAVRKAGFDVVLTGNMSTDGMGGLVPAMVAEWLEVPHATFLSEWTLTHESVGGTRSSDRGSTTVQVAPPVVVSITEAFPDPRLPNFKGIMAAKKKPFQTWTLADLDVSAEPDVPRSIMTAIAEKPARAAGRKIIDEGDGGRQLADYLAQNGLA